MPKPHCLGNPLVYTIFEVILDELVCTRPTAHQVTFGSAPTGQLHILVQQQRLALVLPSAVDAAVGGTECDSATSTLPGGDHHPERKSELMPFCCVMPQLSQVLP